MGDSPKYNSTYSRDYYRANADRIRARKRERYAKDPVVRARMKRAVKKHREKQKNQPRKNKPMTEFVKFPDGTGGMVEMLTISQLAEVVGLKTPTLRKWERENVIPASLYRTPGGHRRYTRDQAIVIRDTYSEFRQKIEPWRLTDEFVAAVHENLESLYCGVKRDE